MFILPSFQSLKIFESAARLASFTKAADELGISQGAVSQHIKNLEIRAGFDVFERTGRRVILTSSGQVLLDAVKHGLGHIQHTIEVEKRKKQANEIVISSQPGFAIRWLLPRIMAFNQAYPKLKISVNTVTSPLDFSLYHAQAGLYYGSKEVKEGETAKLFDEHLIPVCSVKFAEQHKLHPPLNKKQLEKLVNLPLLGDLSPVPPPFDDTWSYWAKAVGLDLSLDHIDRQSQSNITLQLAELGHGIAIGRTSLVMDAIQAGSLIALTQVEVKNPCYYQLVSNPAMPKNKALNTFAAWLEVQSKEINEFKLLT